ncbi:hypothetical protein DN069_20060 [Streptacidiphilus pinicola]|uniref:Uncharacterized protein n=1 Tax=Streptacidiphilus pinicola TaxID=2219663 RepID=A0A2X0J0V0_9ACTN|nr:hypothetical protein [Streptacidiphilus pinicola]RAG83826.1 hypothetical protein DN069_20060 [Streptacidiphilus pinicola]
MPARYHLRFQLHPGPDAAAQAAELAKFCGEAGVDEVVLLLGAEELYDGHPGGPAEDLLVETAVTGLGVLREAGLEVSLNPWVTAGHADRGRADRLGFAPMVAPDGTVAAAQASFACPRWRAWIAAHYARYAALGFRVLWLEDDFRYHNHAPLPWGGGFEPPMLERLAELVGEPVTREQAVAAVTAPGPPHPWRAQLQQVWRTAQLEVAEELAAAVARHSGGRSRLGLMSSMLGVASVEGRDWPALFDTLAIGGRVAHRPHFAGYSDQPGRELSFSVWMLEQQRALRPAWAGSEPEIENWPHTAWSKSDTQTWSELVTAQLAGSDALFLNLHPMHSGRAQRYPGIARLLRRSRPALDFVAAEPAGAFESLGVGLPFRQDAAAHVRTRRGGDLAELAVDPGPAADFLLRYGVPVTAGPARVNALFGQLAWAFADAEVERLLSGGLLLDGAAAAILVERGFGPLLGIEAAELVERDQHPAVPGPYAVERCPTADGEIWLSVNLQPALARLSPVPDATVTTLVTTPDGRPWGPGRCHYTNELGGRVAVLAATAPEQLPFDDDGQRLLHATVRFLEGERPELPLVSGGPHLVPHFVRTASGHRLAVANGSADPARPRVDFPGAAPDARATLLCPLAEPTTAAVATDPAVLTVDTALPHRGWLLLHWA